MSYTATDVKNLREQTGAGMMDCKKALDESAGNFEKAVDYLRAKGLAAAAKKQSRIASEGLISAMVNEKAGAIVEINCETDFVTKNSDFQKFVTDVNQLVLSKGSSNIDSLMNEKLTSGITLKDALSEITIKIGEKIDFRRANIVKLEKNGLIGSYVHSGKIGALVKVESEVTIANNQDVKDLVKDLCMQVAAADAKFLSSSDIDEGFKAREAEVYASQLKEQGKPDNMIPNIVKGKLAKLASEVCLYEQSFVKDPDQTIAQLVESVSKKVGATIKITEFIKINLGEGIQKKEDNFAEEVAKMTGAKN